MGSLGFGPFRRIRADFPFPALPHPWGLAGRPASAPGRGARPAAERSALEMTRGDRGSAGEAADWSLRGSCQLLKKSFFGAALLPAEVGDFT